MSHDDAFWRHWLSQKPFVEKVRDFDIKEFQRDVARNFGALPRTGQFFEGRRFLRDFVRHGYEAAEAGLRRDHYTTLSYNNVRTAIATLLAAHYKTCNGYYCSQLCTVIVIARSKYLNPPVRARNNLGFPYEDDEDDDKGRVANDVLRLYLYRSIVNYLCAARNESYGSREAGARFYREWDERTIPPVLRPDHLDLIAAYHRLEIMHHQYLTYVRFMGTRHKTVVATHQVRHANERGQFLEAIAKLYNAEKKPLQKQQPEAVARRGGAATSKRAKQRLLL